MSSRSGVISELEFLVSIVIVSLVSEREREISPILQLLGKVGVCLKLSIDQA